MKNHQIIYFSGVNIMARDLYLQKGVMNKHTKLTCDLCNTGQRVGSAQGPRLQVLLHCFPAVPIQVFRLCLGRAKEHERVSNDHSIMWAWKGDPSLLSTAYWPHLFTGSCLSSPGWGKAIFLRARKERRTECRIQ